MASWAYCVLPFQSKLATSHLIKEDDDDASAFLSLPCNNPGLSTSWLNDADAGHEPCSAVDVTQARGRRTWDEVRMNRVVLLLTVQLVHQNMMRDVEHQPGP